MNEETQEKVNNLSMLEQNVQQLAAQRQSFQTQLIEVESAIEELGTSKDAYKIIGSIMVKVEAEKLKEELESKKSLLNIRIKSVEKQEDMIKEKAKKLQEEVMASINANNASENSKEDNKNSKEKNHK
jgi:prefoldin beta subunit